MVFLRFLLLMFYFERRGTTVVSMSRLVAVVECILLHPGYTRVLHGYGKAPAVPVVDEVVSSVRGVFPNNLLPYGGCITIPSSAWLALRGHYLW